MTAKNNSAQHARYLPKIPSALKHLLISRFTGQNCILKI